MILFFNLRHNKLWSLIFYRKIKFPTKGSAKYENAVINSRSNLRKRKHCQNLPQIPFCEKEVAFILQKLKRVKNRREGMS